MGTASAKYRGNPPPFPGRLHVQYPGRGFNEIAKERLSAIIYECEELRDRTLGSMLHRWGVGGFCFLRIPINLAVNLFRVLSADVPAKLNSLSA